MSDDLAARRAQGQMVCLRCGAFSSARYCYGCQSAVVFEDVMRGALENAVERLKQAEAALAEQRQGHIAELQARQAAEARAERLAASVRDYRQEHDMCTTDDNEPECWCEMCTQARQALAE